MSLMRRLAIEHPPAGWLADEFAAADLNVAADGDDVGPALNGYAFEGDVIDVHELDFLRNRPSVGRVDDHQVRVRAGLDRPCLREEAEQLGRLGAGNFDEPVQIDPAGRDAVAIEQMNAVLDA